MKKDTDRSRYSEDVDGDEPPPPPPSEEEDDDEPPPPDYSEDDEYDIEYVRALGCAAMDPPHVS